MDLFIDSETLPTIDPKVIERIAASLKAPGSMKKPETIAKWEAEEKPAALAEAISKTALDGAFGRVAVISWAFGDEEPVAISPQFIAGDDFDEKSLIEDFFICVGIERQVNEPVRLIGHNILGRVDGFDQDEGAGQRDEGAIVSGGLLAA